MNRWTQLLISGGVLASFVGLLIVARPALALHISANDVIVTLLGIAAAIQGLRAVSKRWNTEIKYTTFPSPEYYAGTKVPGDDIDSDLAARLPTVRDRIEKTAVRVLTHTSDITEDQARKQLKKGSWTERPLAAAFLSPEASIDSFSERLRFRQEPLIVRQGRAAMAALMKRFEMKPATGSWTDQPERDVITMPPGNGGPEEGVAFPSEGSMIDRKTERWRGVSAFALIAGAAGMFVNQPSLLLVAAVGGVVTAFAAFGRVGEQQPATLELDRCVSRETATPDSEVRVRVTVRNVGENLQPDIRIVDGVPPGLCVENGSPRCGMSLRPGESEMFEYSVQTTFGSHAFQPAMMVTYSLTEERESLQRLHTTEQTTISCRDPSPEIPRQIPTRTQTSNRRGNESTEAGGAGIEFHSIREYRRGDPLSLIDWNRLARTGDLATLQFQEERTAIVMLVIDARREAQLAPDLTTRSAIDRSRQAADELICGLLNENNRFGVAAISPHSCWLRPGGGSRHRLRARQLLASHPALTSIPTDTPTITSVQFARLRRHLVNDAQLVFFSPLPDDNIVNIIREIEVSGNSVSVVSPDPTMQATLGRQFAHIERQLRITRLRAIGIPVYDWTAEESFTRSFAKTEQQSFVSR